MDGNQKQQYLPKKNNFAKMDLNELFISEAKNFYDTNIQDVKNIRKKFDICLLFGVEY